MQVKSKKTEYIHACMHAYTYIHRCIYTWIVSSPPLKLRAGVEGGGFLFLKFGQRGWSWKNCSKIGGFVERGVLLERGGFPYCFISFLQKSMFSLPLDFFCLINIHTCCNQWIYSFMWFTNRSILSCGFLFTRKWYIMKFLFLLLLFLTWILWKFHCYWCLFPFQFH